MGFSVDGQSIIIAGGSKGLGRELAAQLVQRGANVVILARNMNHLETARDSLLPLRKRPEQTVDIKSVDLANASEVKQWVASLPVLPSTLFCVAGRAADDLGFFADITTDQIHSCFQENYFSSAYITHAVLQRWLEQPPDPAIVRHIAFTASTAAFVALPGYVAYTPTKTALRALADTLRLEVLLYKEQQTIQVHCSYPNTILGDSFTEEQEKKPELCKVLEGSEDSQSGLTPETVAKGIIAGVDRGDHCITFDFETQLLLNNMRGPSVPNTFIWDWLLGFIASLVWPFFRRSWDRKTVQYGSKNKLN